MITSLTWLKKGRRVLGVLLAIVLVAGVFGSYVIYGSPKTSSPSQDQKPAASPVRQTGAKREIAREQISRLESEIAGLQNDARVKPGDAEIFLKLGDSQYTLGNLYLYVSDDKGRAGESFKAAVASYQRALLLNPREKGINLRLAIAALYAGDDKLAGDNFRAAVKADPDDNIARLNYGMYLASIKGNYREAVEQWRELLKNNPDPNTAAHAREMIMEAESRL